MHFMLHHGLLSNSGIAYSSIMANKLHEDSKKVDVVALVAVVVSFVAIIIAVLRGFFGMTHETAYVALTIVGVLFYLVVAVKLLCDGKRAASVLLIIFAFCNLTLVFL